jgi:hypothetical protein
MSEISCAQLRELGAELALGILDGRQRAELMTHVDVCDSCRDELRQLAQVREELLALVPASEPPLGFESSVLRSLGFTTRHRRRWLRPLAAAVALLIALAAGWFLAPRTQDSVVSADLTADGHTVGQAFLYTRSPSWIYMTVNTPGPSEEISCQLQRTDGTWITTGWFSLTSGLGYWGGPSRAVPADVTAIRLLRADGTLLATATLPPQ